MWSRRRFLETASSLPVVGGIAAAGTGAAEAASKGSADYFRDLGVRPFINAAGTYTAMTASLMPQEVLDAIQYAAQRFVMLDELHDKVGQRHEDVEGVAMQREEVLGPRLVVAG